MSSFGEHPNVWSRGIPQTCTIASTRVPQSWQSFVWAESVWLRAWDMCPRCRNTGRKLQWTSLCVSWAFVPESKHGFCPQRSGQTYMEHSVLGLRPLGSRRQRAQLSLSHRIKRSPLALWLKSALAFDLHGREPSRKECGEPSSPSLLCVFVCGTVGVDSVQGCQGGGCLGTFHRPTFPQRFSLPSA